VKILLADKLHPQSIEAMRQIPGAQVDNSPSLGPDDLPAKIAGFDVLIVRSTKVTAATIAAADELGLVIRAGSGYNTIDVEGASAKGIYVANCPGKNAVAVAELAVGLILSLERSIADNVVDLRAGRWNKGKYSKAAGLKGKTVGLVGLGSIAQETAERLRPFGVKLVAWSRSLTEEQAEKLGVSRVELFELAEVSDIISLHVALAPETRGFINQAFLEKMKPGGMLINTCRAEVVDSKALLEVMNSKGIRYGSDVLDQEPSGKEGDFVSEIGQHPNCYATHHIGASTDQAEYDTGMEACRIVEAYAQGQSIPNCVNMRTSPVTGHVVAIRHEDRVGVLAGILGVLKEHGHNVQEMENLIFAGAKAACARLTLDCPVDSNQVTALKKCEGVISIR
jgi:D-3-phosphoglycerate dehydrogenase / 2-oxoglutarate reductase